MDRAGKLQSARGRLHTAVTPDEQLIGEHKAQAIECLTDRRLTQAVALSRTGYVAFRHQCIEYDQKVEVDCAQIPFGYDIHIA
jgi:hypothetical protein